MVAAAPTPPPFGIDNQNRHTTIQKVKRTSGGNSSRKPEIADSS